MIFAAVCAVKGRILANFLAVSIKKTKMRLKLTPLTVHEYRNAHPTPPTTSLDTIWPKRFLHLDLWHALKVKCVNELVEKCPEKQEFPSHFWPTFSRENMSSILLIFQTNLEIVDFLTHFLTCCVNAFLVLSTVH